MKPNDLYRRNPDVIYALVQRATDHPAPTHAELTGPIADHLHALHGPALDTIRRTLADLVELGILRRRRPAQHRGRDTNPTDDVYTLTTLGTLWWNRDLHAITTNLGVLAPYIDEAGVTYPDLYRLIRQDTYDLGYDHGPPPPPPRPPTQDPHPLANPLPPST